MRDQLQDTYGLRVALVGTGQTAAFQGIKPCVCLDALPMDFAVGELQKAIWTACGESPDLVVVEGQGSLLNPAYGCETLAIIQASRPVGFVYVTVPERQYYADFPSVPIADMACEIQLIIDISRSTLMGICVSSLDMSYDCAHIERDFVSVPVVHGLGDRFSRIVDNIFEIIRS